MEIQFDSVWNDNKGSVCQIIHDHGSSHDSQHVRGTRQNIHQVHGIKMLMFSVVKFVKYVHVHFFISLALLTGDSIVSASFFTSG